MKRDITEKFIEQLGKGNAHTLLFKYAAMLGLARLVLEEDQCWRIEDLEGDCYNPQANPDIPAGKLAAERRAYRRRVRNEGVWGAIVEVRSNPNAEWMQPPVTVKQVWSEHYGRHFTCASGTDSIWGFVGEDFLGSGYEQQMCDTAAEWLFSNTDNRALAQGVDGLMAGLDAMRKMYEAKKLEAKA